MYGEPFAGIISALFMSSIYPLLAVMTTSVGKIYLSCFLALVTDPFRKRSSCQEYLLPVAFVIMERLATVGAGHASPGGKFLNFFGYEFRD